MYKKKHESSTVITYIGATMDRLYRSHLICQTNDLDNNITNCDHKQNSSNYRKPRHLVILQIDEEQIHGSKILNFVLCL